MCYSAFPSPYDPSSANNTCIFSGSDIANNPLAPLWGSRFESANHMTWMGRNDLQTMQNMGVTLVRLYDWAPRNRHLSGQPQWILDEMDALWAERRAKLEPSKA